jgi:hypothetical protein
MVVCDHNCFNCKYPDCICEDKPSEDIDQFALTPEQLKKKESMKRWSDHGKVWKKNHKAEAKAYHHQYYMARREKLIARQQKYRANKKTASRRQSESGAVENKSI